MKKYEAYIRRNLKNVEKYFTKEDLDTCINDYMVLVSEDKIFSMPYFKRIVEQNKIILKGVEHETTV